MELLGTTELPKLLAAAAEAAVQMAAQSGSLAVHLNGSALQLLLISAETDHQAVQPVVQRAATEPQEPRAILQECLAAAAAAQEAAGQLLEASGARAAFPVAAVAVVGLVSRHPETAAQAAMAAST